MAYAPIGDFPTPIEKADRLGTELGIASLYIKRDDRSDPTFGGSKTRKLAFLLADALKRNATKVVTFGSVGSNHAMATALFGRRLGLHTVLMLMPEPPSCRVQDMLLAEHELGAEQIFFDSSVKALSAAGRMEREAPGQVYVIPPGGSSPVGNAGYVDAAFELQEQVAAGLLPEPDYIYLAMGSMGGAVGLAIGLKAAGMKTRVVPIRTTSFGAANDEKMMELFGETVSHLRKLDVSFPAVRLARSETGIRHEYVGKGYAIPSAAGHKAIEAAPELGLDSTYTAKAFAAVMDDAHKLTDKVVVFWATQSATQVKPDGGTLEELAVPFRSYGCR
jgi:D-cysteine desulfhydrase